MNFWCHVAFSSELGLGIATSISSLSRGSEAEIGNLQVEILVEKYILWLKISVSNTLIVNIFKSIDQLMEVESGNRIRESTGGGNIVE